MSTPAVSESYASLLRRFQAVVSDMAIWAMLFVAAIFVPGLLELPAALTRLIGVSFIVGLILYEPTLVATRGGTIGHFRYGIRVVAVNGSHLSWLRAFGRVLLKGLFGWLSFPFMLLTKRAQSLHDLAARSVVIVAAPEDADALDVATPTVIDPTGLPSKTRRVVVIVAYSFVAMFVYYVLTFAMVSESCALGGPCTPTESLLLTIGDAAWLFTTGACVVAGWRGQLLGARRRALPPPN